MINFDDIIKKEQKNIIQINQKFLIIHTGYENNLEKQIHYLI